MSKSFLMSYAHMCNPIAYGKRVTHGKFAHI